MPTRALPLFVAIVLIPLLGQAEPGLEKVSVKVERAPFVVGEQHRIKSVIRIVDSWKGKNESSSTERGGTYARTLTVAAVDSAGQVTKVRVQHAINGRAVDQTVKRGQKLTKQSQWLAKELFDPNDLVVLPLRGTLKPGQAVTLGKVLWGLVHYRGKLSNQVVTYEGIETGTGFAYLSIRCDLAEVDVEVKGSTKRAHWSGHLAFDPKTGRLRRLHLDADSEVFLPPGKAGKTQSEGKVRYERQVLRPAKKKRK